MIIANKSPESSIKIVNENESSENQPQSDDESQQTPSITRSLKNNIFQEKGILRNLF